MTRISEPKEITEIEEALRLLLSGIAQDDLRRIRDSWRVLVASGQPVTKPVLRKLKKGNWNSYSNKIEGRYLMVLMSLLHEIDPKAAKTELFRLSALKIHRLHELTIRVAKSRILDAPDEGACCGIPLVISTDIAAPDHVRRRIEVWLNTRPSQDLESITRIDVIAYDPQFNYLGNYNIMFSGITLVWPRHKDSFAHRWLNDLNTEFTFYHEIGHHALGHLEGGRIQQQEVDANKYASKAVRKARPIFTIVTLPVWLSFRLRNAWRKRR